MDEKTLFSFEIYAIWIKRLFSGADKSESLQAGPITKVTEFSLHKMILLQNSIKLESLHTLINTAYTAYC